MAYPQILKLRQQLDHTEIKDISSVVKQEFEKLNIGSRIKHGSRVAITAGSRGIKEIVPILAAIIREVKLMGGNPFIVPAMGSHGGSTAAGQKAILEDYGITEHNVGASIESSMDVIKIGELENGMPVMIDKIACQADHIVVVNRIKPHTEFQGQIESGLMKMMVIGLGKHKGTIIAHDFAVKYGYERTIIDSGKCILENAPIAMGIGIIENGYGKTARIAAVLAEDLLETEKKLLQLAREKTPYLPFDEIDILVVDECGKEISGTGMDTKVLGRIMNIYELEIEHPKITRIVLRDLSKKTHGNAIGVGLADFVTQKVADKIDYRSMYINCVTAVTPEKGRLPIVCKNDKEAIDFAIATAGPSDADTLRMVWIKNTSTLDEMYVSQGLKAKAEENGKLTIEGEPIEIKFDPDGNLIKPSG
jgi:Lactate racemase N-terminal domain